MLPSIDQFLIDAIETTLVGIQTDKEWMLVEIFSDRPPVEVAEAREYFSRMGVTRNITERADDRSITIMGGYPRFDVPRPQIAVLIGNEQHDDFYLGDFTGDVTLGSVANSPIGPYNYADRERLYHAHGTYKIQVVAETWKEAVWLTKVVQRAILGQSDALLAQGIGEVGFNIDDLRLDTSHAPSVFFARQITVMARIPQTWMDRKIIQGAYQTGRNDAMTGLYDTTGVDNNGG